MYGCVCVCVCVFAAATLGPLLLLPPPVRRACTTPTAGGPVGDRSRREEDRAEPGANRQCVQVLMLARHHARGVGRRMRWPIMKKGPGFRRQMTRGGAGCSGSIPRSRFTGGTTQDAEKGRAGARRGAVVGVVGDRCDRQSVARYACREVPVVVPRACQDDGHCRHCWPPKSGFGSPKL